MKRIGRHAVVIGGSLGGLLAARVLTDFYDHVTIIERDTFPQPGEQRKGVPQGRHAHGLLARGRELLERFFPGFTDEMVAQGGMSADICEGFHWYASGGFLKPTNSGMVGLLISRPRLEAGVRSRVLALPAVRTIENCDVAGLVTTADRSQITGVRLMRKIAGHSEEMVEADLVVDATGRGSRTPARLAAMGYEQPQEEQIRVDVGYTTCRYRRRPDQLSGKMGFAIAAEPPRGRTGVVMAQEGDTWIVSIGGFNGDFAPLDQEGFVEYARGLPNPEIYDLIKDAEPLGEPVGYRFVASQRRRYEHLKSFPAGFLVFGDAICSFNPIYGQGMTVATIEALTLQDCLSAGSEGLALRFFKAASTAVDVPWSIAVGNDLRFPHVEGPRTLMGNFINWYISKLQRAAHQDASLSVTFLRTVNMVAPPAALLAPGVMLRVLRGNLRRGTRKQQPRVSGAPVPLHS